VDLAAGECRAYSKDPRVILQLFVLPIDVGPGFRPRGHISKQMLGLSLISVVQPPPGEEYEEKQPRVGDCRC
jgi:hypothetical protein